jgi:nucleoside-diphosphate-sugar epimerase
MSNGIDLFGGTGFIGTEFFKLYSLCTSLHDRENNFPLYCESAHYCDYRNILYMISTTHNYNVLDNPHIDIDTNLSKLLKVLENCKNNDIIFNYVSTWYVYGNSDIPANEKSPCNPTGFYSITKKCAEDLIISYCRTFNIKYRILRLGNVYGTTDKNASAKKNALSYLTNEILNNRNINLYFDGNFIRDYIHVKDTCKAIKLCIDKGEINTIYNISNGKPLIFKDLINYIIKASNSKSRTIPIDQPHFHKIVQVKDMYLDSSKLFSLGYTPDIDIYSGLDMLIQK